MQLCFNRLQSKYQGPEKYSIVVSVVSPVPADFEGVAGKTTVGKASCFYSNRAGQGGTLFQPAERRNPAGDRRAGMKEAHKPVTPLSVFVILKN